MATPSMAPVLIVGEDLVFGQYMRRGSALEGHTIIMHVRGV
jgi:hypothetical protein